MLFSSITFIFMFLPLVFASYFLIKPQFKNNVLLIFSVLFYAWGELRHLYIIFLITAIDYFSAIIIEKMSRYKKFFLSVIVLLNLSFLVYFKYYNFIINNINSLFGVSFSTIDAIMPVGISFYIFQAISYLVDVYRGDVKAQKNISNLILYVSLFPQLVAGPIVKYSDIENQLENRDENFNKIVSGVKRFIFGLSKKVLIANTLGAVADKVFIDNSLNFSTTVAWIGAVAYSFQLFYDFSGYSDMAIGLASIFGFDFLENFDYPYISKSITEFWRRWHISLSSWFKNYIYIPLGGNRKGTLRAYFNIFVVFLTTGIWHGADWSFIIWGLWHCLFNVLEKATEFNKKAGKITAIIQHIYTLLVVVIGWILFRANSLSYGLSYIKNMFGFMKHQNLQYELSYYIGNKEILAFVVAFLCSMPIFKNIVEISKKNKYLHIVVNIWIILLFVVSISFIVSSSYQPFIYFQF